MTLTDLDSRNGCRRVLSLCGNWALSLRLSSGSQVDVRGGVATVKMTGSRSNSSCSKVAEQLSYQHAISTSDALCFEVRPRSKRSRPHLRPATSGLWTYPLVEQSESTIRSAVRHWPLNEHVWTAGEDLSFGKRWTPTGAVMALLQLYRRLHTVLTYLVAIGCGRAPTRPHR